MSFSLPLLYIQTLVITCPITGSLPQIFPWRAGNPVRYADAIRYSA
ncbi:hypothetical protein [Escherichia coli]